MSPMRILLSGWHLLQGQAAAPTSLKFSHPLTAASYGISDITKREQLFPPPELSPVILSLLLLNGARKLSTSQALHITTNLMCASNSITFKATVTISILMI